MPFDIFGDVGLTRDVPAHGVRADGHARPDEHGRATQDVGIGVHHS